MSKFRRFAHRLDTGLDTLRLRYRRRAGRAGPAKVQAHRGFGTPTRLIVSGHVIKGSADDPEPEPGVGLMADIRATVRRYIESEVMGARLTIRAGAAQAVTFSDSDGYFSAELPVVPPAGESEGGGDGVTWRDVTVTLDDVPGSRLPPQEVGAEVMVVPAGTRFGVISDIDDTVMNTGISNLRRNWRQVIRSDPRLREAFPGLPELYRALACDRHGVQRQPIFYVSSASWGFYKLFTRFMELQRIPRGPLLLKNYGLDGEQWFSGDHSLHKTRMIERLFATYPDMRFILVGDSGQHDARIYRGVVDRHPDRVLAVWIRDVSDKPERKAEIQTLIDELREAGVPAAFGPHLLGAATEAAQAGWIDPAAVDAVAAAVAEAAHSGTLEA
ncbi:MAG: phosphatase domain-containing protein [Burkholderiaceae bacterium]